MPVCTRARDYNREPAPRYTKEPYVVVDNFQIRRMNMVTDNGVKLVSSTTLKIFDIDGGFRIQLFPKHPSFYREVKFQGTTIKRTDAKGPLEYGTSALTNSRKWLISILGPQDTLDRVEIVCKTIPGVLLSIQQIRKCRSLIVRSCDDSTALKEHLASDRKYSLLDFDGCTDLWPDVLRSRAFLNSHEFRLTNCGPIPTQYIEQCRPKVFSIRDQHFPQHSINKFLKTTVFCFLPKGVGVTATLKFDDEFDRRILLNGICYKNLPELDEPNAQTFALYVNFEDSEDPEFNQVDTWNETSILVGTIKVQNGRVIINMPDQPRN